MPHPIVALVAATPADLLHPYGARIREMRAQGFQVIAFTDGGREVDALRDLGAEHRQLPTSPPQDPARLAVAWLLLTSTCIERQVLLVHSLDPALHLTAALAARAASVPLMVATTADHTPHKPLRRAALQAAARLADAWIVPFAAERDHAATFVPQDRLHLVEAEIGADVRALNPRRDDLPTPEEARARFGLDGAPRWIGTFSRLQPPDTRALLAALDRAQQQDPDLGWVVASCAPLPNDLLTALRTRQDQGRPVVALPDRARNEVAPLFRALDLQALPWTTPGAAFAAMEAAAMGLPTVAFDQTDTRDLILDGQTGALVPPGDTPAFVDALTRIVRSERRRRDLGIAARARAEHHFDYEFGQSHLFGIYDTLIKAKGL